MGILAGALKAQLLANDQSAIVAVGPKAQLKALKAMLQFGPFWP